jgi:hypothetical protein
MYRDQIRNIPRLYRVRIGTLFINLLFYPYVQHNVQLSKFIIYNYIHKYNYYSLFVIREMDILF